MADIDMTVQAEKHRIDCLVDYRWYLVSIVVVLSLFLAILIPTIKVDPTLKSVLVTSSSSFFEYQKFREFFDDDEFVVVSIKPQVSPDKPQTLANIDGITQNLSKIDGIVEVISLTNLRIYQKHGENLSNQYLVARENDQLQFPAGEILEKVRKAVPITDLLVSRDQKTVGILFRIDEELKFDHNANKDILAKVRDVIKSNLPAETDFRIVGQAELRQAILKYTLRTALIFGVLCTLICLTVTGYVFRNITVTAVTMSILGLCVLWVLGIMAVLNVPINATTSLSFGLILITTLEMVIHMVTRYNQFRQELPDRTQAVKLTVRFLSRPFLTCSATTAVGFGSCMITSIPMIFQLGLIMSLSISIAFCLAMILVPTVIIALKSMDLRVDDKEGAVQGSSLLVPVMNSIKNHYRFYTIAGFGIILAMLSGLPLIRSDPQILHQLGEARQEVMDVRFVEANLSSIHSVQLMVETNDNAFKTAPAWRKIEELEARLSEIPHVTSTDSLLPLLNYIRTLVMAQDQDPNDFFSNPKLLPQILFLTSFTSEGKRLIRRHVDDDFSRLNITVRINNAPSVPVMNTVSRIKATAESVMRDFAGVTVTGELVVVAAQGEDLIDSEIQSMFVAIGVIAVLMMIQMGSIPFGLISLIPNIPPVATVFGIMGYLKIPLDGVTVFAATVAIGLAVDNTIQFVAQLKREIMLHPGKDVEYCMFRAYRLAAKPMVSWSIVTLLGFLSMVATPFQAAVSFGILVASAVFMGIFGDLIFMQSMILTFPRIRRIIQGIVERESLSSMRRDPHR
jgi:predicted RND superfamily exporter protein